MITIHVSDKLKKRYPVFEGGEPEDFIVLIKRHEGLLKDLRLKENYEEKSTEKQELESEATRLKDCIAVLSDNDEKTLAKEELEELRDSIREINSL